MTRRPAPAIALTRALVDACHPEPARDGPEFTDRLTESDIDASIEATLAGHPDDRDLWLFAYGSLLWQCPELDIAERVPGLVRGWHRRFCLWQWAARGCPDRPCLMLALDRGGAARSLVYRIAPPGVRDKVRAVWRREIRGDGYRPRWVRADTPRGSVRAVTFVINRAGERYAGRLPDEVVADTIAAGCGAKGPCAEYLCRAVESLESLGLRDAHLWRLQHMVAERLARSMRRAP